jgi:hypothetical protein
LVFWNLKNKREVCFSHYIIYYYIIYYCPPEAVRHACAASGPQTVVLIPDFALSLLELLEKSTIRNNDEGT